MITAVAGSNDYLMKEEVNKLTSSFIDKNGDLALEKFDGEDLEFDKLLDALQAVPFLSNTKMVVVRSLGSNKALAEQAEKIFAGVADSTELILYEPGIDKRTVYYKALQKNKNINLVEYGELDSIGLANWLIKVANAKGGELSFNDARYLVERVGQNQMFLANELDKLLTYNPKITRESIDLLTDPTPQSKIFELLDAAFAGNRQKALALYDDQRAQRVEPQVIIGMLAWQLHILLLVKTAGNLPTRQIATDSGINPYVVEKSQNLAKNISLGKLKSLTTDLLEIDIKGKTTTYNLDLALQTLILSI